jgi:phosphoenolpyruvate-protein kinase (PTS system EI component)
VRTVYKGQSATEGVALGRLLRVDRPSTGEGGGIVPVGEAFSAVDADLEALESQLRRDGQDEAADIVSTNRLMAGDPDLRAAVDAAVAAGTAAEAAIAEAVEAQAQVLAGLPDPTLAGRAADVRAVGRRLLARLAGKQPAAQPGHTDPVVVAAHEVSADDLLTAGMQLAGAVSVLGGAGAHAGIVARSLGIPLVVAVDPAALDLTDGTEVLVDATAGTVTANPEPAERAIALTVAEHVRERRAALAAARSEPVRTRAGVEVTVLANVGSLTEAQLAVGNGAPGVGLLRTEMPFLAATHWPTADEHVAILRPILACFPGQPVTVRTLDFGADKLPPFLTPEHVRGLLPDDALRTQFAAILEAAGEARIRIMIPMVSTVAALQTCRRLLGEVTDQPVPLGAMVETPEAIAIIDDLAAAADFLSIGSNDLTAALLGLDRRDPALTPARAAEPVVRDAIAATVRAGAAAGTPVSICGDAASEPSVIPLLVEIGCHTLSVAPATLDEVRAQVRTL